MSTLIHILHLEDDPMDGELVQAGLEEAGLTFRMTRVQTRPAFEAALRRHDIDIVLADYRLPAYDGMSALECVREVCPDIPFIFVSGTMGEDAAIEALTKGATDYVLKEKLMRLGSAVKRALSEVGNRRDRERLQDQLNQSQKMESVGRLAGGVAHDFNNMLNVILGRAELAMEKIDPSHPIFNDLQEIKTAADRSAKLTRQLLAFAREQAVEPKVLDLNETVEGMLRMLRRLISEEIDLVWQPAKSVWPIKVDPSQIDQIMANLCVNARDAIAGVGRITIETGTRSFDPAFCAYYPECVPGEYVSLTVSDDGCGMDKETLSKIFEPFFTTKEVGKGTGLGLAMVYGIVKQNNGLINVYSEPGQGTTFKLYLPRYTNEREEAPLRIREAPLARGDETILLVEDEHSILEMASAMLENYGYRVLSASTPGEAMRLAETYEGEIHLLIVDVIMPEMNGRDLAKHLAECCPQMSCLFMSGYSGDVIAHHGMLDEGVNFIQKPFAMQDLVTKVRLVLDSDD